MKGVVLWRFAFVALIIIITIVLCASLLPLRQLTSQRLDSVGMSRVFVRKPAVVVGRRVTCNTYGQNTICQHGDIVADKKYVVISASLVSDNSLSYLFNTPLTALAWKRIGYHCLVLLVGDPNQCDAGSKVRFVFETLLSMTNVVVLTMDGVSSNHSVMISQTSRLYAVSLVQRVAEAGWDDVFLVTGDADVWPLLEGKFRDFLDLTNGTEVLFGEIGTIELLERPVTHVNLFYIGTKVKTWKDIMSSGGTIHLPNSPDQIVRHFFEVFGDEALCKVSHGGPGWFLDQFMFSLRLDEWKTRQTNASQKMKTYMHDSLLFERIHDAIPWNVSTICDKLDVHLKKQTYKSEIWIQIRPLLPLVYPDPSVVRWCDDYYDAFISKTDSCI